MAMAQWKKVIWIGTAVACLVLALLLVFWRLPRRASSSSPPKPWNSEAIKGTFVGVRVREIDPANSAVVFFFDLQNNTDFDYQLVDGPNVIFMSRLKSDGSLSSEKPVKLDHPAFLPARNRTRIGLEISRPFAWSSQTGSASDDKVRELVNREVANLDGFVLFDEATRYQIELRGLTAPQ